MKRSQVIDVQGYTDLQQEARSIVDGNSAFSKNVQAYPYSRTGVNFVSEPFNVYFALNFGK